MAKTKHLTPIPQPGPRPPETAATAALRDEYRDLARRGYHVERVRPWVSEVAAELRAAVAQRLDAEIMRSLGPATGSTIWTAGTNATTINSSDTTPTLWGVPIITSNYLQPGAMVYVNGSTAGSNVGAWHQVYDYDDWRYVTPWAPPQGAVIVPITPPDLTQPYNAFAEPPYNPYEAMPPLLDDSAPSRRRPVNDFAEAPRADGLAYGPLVRRPTYVEALSRAEALLRRFLTPMQLAQFNDTESFEVTGSLGGRYRIRYGIAGNIQRLDRVSGDWIETWCVHPADVPPGDAMLAQKVMLEQDEAHVRERANITHRDGGYTAGRNHPLRYA